MESKRALVLHWIEQGVLDRTRGRQALSAAGVLPDRLRWKMFIENLLVWLGALALAFAVMFFIAFNWDAMGRFAKFGLIEVLIALCLFAYWKFDPAGATAKAALVAASLLLGVLLAFYGQTYQTGADPWQLFANWALLMLPWALLARFAAIWVLWAALLNLAIMLYFYARGNLFWLVFDSTEHILWVLFIFNAVIWLSWELLAKRYRWLAERWAVRLVAIACGVAITMLCLYAIFDDYAGESGAVLLYFSWLAVLYLVYRRIIPDLFMLAGLCMSGITVLMTFFGWHMFHGNDAVGAFLVLTILVIGLAAGAAYWLNKVYKEQQA